MGEESSQSGSNSSDKTLVPWMIASAVILLIVLIRAVYELSWPIDHDSAMFLAAAQLLLEGKLPYVDFIEINPPMVFYLSAIPALISNVSGLPICPVFLLLIWLTAVACLVLTVLIFRQARNHPDFNCFGAIILSQAALNLIVVEWGDFGQRKHLIAVAMTPFFACRLLRWQGYQISSVTSAITGIIFGLILCMSPPYAIIPAAVELTLMAKYRRIAHLFAPEIIGCALTIALYAMHFLLLPDSVKHGFFDRVMPLIVAGYKSYNCKLDMLTVYPLTIGMLPLLIIGLLIAIRYRNSITLPSISWWIAAYIAVVAQSKGWMNHYLPMFSGALLFSFNQMKLRLDKRTTWPPYAQILAVTGVFLLFTLPAIVGRHYVHKYIFEPLPTIEKYTSPGDNVIIISPDVPDAYPALLKSGRRNGSRYLFQFALYMVKFAIANSTSDKEKQRWQAEYDRLVDELIEDIEQSGSKLVFIAADEIPNERVNSLLLQKYERIGQVKARASNLSVWKLKV